MQLEIAPDLEELIHRRLSSGAYASPGDVVRHAPEAQKAHVETGYRQAERGELLLELLPAGQAKQEIGSIPFS